MYVAMNPRLLRWILLLAVPVLAQDTGGAPGAAAKPDIARLFPADTFAYLEVDASAPAECLPAWQIAKIAGDPALKVLFGPAFAQLGLDPERPLAALLEKLAPKEYLDGPAAVGIRGVSVVVHDAQGRDWKFRVSPGAPVDGAYMYRFIGMMLALDGPAGAKVTMDFDVDFLAIGRPGPRGRQLIQEFLKDAGDEVARDTVKVAGLDATHVVLNVPLFGGFSFGYNFYATERDGTWYLATQTDTLEQALTGGPRTSLAASASLAQARARFTGGRPLLLAHLDLGLLIDAYRGFIPKIAEEMGEIAGLNAIRGVGVGVSLVDGGVRESVGITLDGRPRGMWRILEGMPAGLRSLDVAPPGALAAVAVKLDLKVLRERVREFCATVVPGNEDQIETEILREISPPGIDIVNGVIPALRDEIALFVYPARANELFPGFVLGADARDEDALARLVAAVQQQIPKDVATFAPVELPEGVRAVQVFVQGAPYSMHFAIHKGRFLLASSSKLLVEAATKWGVEGAPRLVRDDAILPPLLKSLNGGDSGNVAALAYVSLRGCGAEAAKALPLWGPALPKEWFDQNGVTDIRRIPNHLTGMAVALRHDKDGLVLDAFSPVGVLVPAFVALLAFERQAVMARQVAIQQAGTGRASLGITTKTSDGAGVKVLGLAAGGASARAGLRQGDKLIAVDGIAIATMEDLDRELGKRKPGEQVKLGIRRADGEVTVVVELDEEEETGW